MPAVPPCVAPSLLRCSASKEALKASSGPASKGAVSPSEAILDSNCLQLGSEFGMCPFLEGLSHVKFSFLNDFLFWDFVSFSPRSYS